MSLSTLPSDIFIHGLVKYLTYKSVLLLAQVCKSLSIQCRKDEVWKILFRRDLSQIVQVKTHRSAYLNYFVIATRDHEHMVSISALYSGYEQALYRCDAILQKYGLPRIPETITKHRVFDCDIRLDLLKWVYIGAGKKPSHLSRLFRRALEEMEEDYMDYALQEGYTVESTDLTDAIRNSSFSIFKKLHGLFGTSTDNRLCMDAAVAGKLEIVKYLTTRLKGPFDDYAIEAASNRRFHVVTYFVELGCKDHTKILHCCLRYAPLSLVKLLVELGANYWSVLRTATSPAIFFGQMAENHEFLLSL